MTLIFGLPLHPLVVHLPVVLLPVSGIAFIVLAFVERGRKHYALPALIILALGALGSIAAWLTGGVLAEQVGEPQRHALWGTVTMITALVTLGLAIAWFLVQRRSEQKLNTRALDPIIAVASGVLIVVTVLAGHSGATAVWGDLGSASPTPSVQPTDSLTPTPTTQPTQEPSAEPSATDEAEDTYTMAEVATHNTADDCWAVVEGVVYDLTEWISQHPGGSGPITGLCGTDASSAFQAQHGDAERPNEALEGFRIGQLSQ